MTTTKYSKERLEEAVKNSASYAGVLRDLGIKQAGGSHSHIKKMIEFYEINVSHFTLKGWNKGLTSSKRKTAKDILVLKTPKDHKAKSIQLRRALIEIGRPEICEKCETGTEYNGLPLVLEIDHIDGNSWDHREHNLRFLCPNCHSQQTTNKPWKTKNS